LFGPAPALGRARCSVVENPYDAVEAAAVEVTLAASTGLVVRPIDPPGPEQPTGRGRRCVVELVPPRRGVLTDCTFELSSAAPFGLLWWTRQVTVPLSRPLAVAPAVGAPGEVEHHHDDDAGDVARPVPRRVGEPRGVRDYLPGDLRSWVHWRATAHSGTLMVREMEGPASRPVTVSGMLPPDPDAADEEARRAMGTIAEHLAAGRSVVLVTAEPDGVIQGPVSGMLDAGSRLARALPQRPATGGR
jgi:uncharacterized protein (DUF58 family)